jgi:hypothetical protein
MNDWDRVLEEEGRAKMKRKPFYLSVHEDYVWVDPRDLPRMDLVEQLRSFAAASPEKFMVDK